MMRRYWHFLLCVLCASAASAQEITVLDWDELRAGSLLPLYTEVVPLETDYRQNDYTVRVEFPEWAPLNAQETREVLPYAHRIADTLRIFSQVNVSRRQGMMDIAFHPYICRSGKFYKLISASITITPHAKKGMQKLKPVTRARAEHSVLASGKWRKISVTADGIYRLTPAALRKMGFSNPDKVRLYGYGGYRLPEVMKEGAYYDDLVEVPMYRSGSDWLFWANGLQYWEGNKRIFNPYANKACYFLTEAADGTADISVLPAETGTPEQTYTNFTDHILYEHDEFAYMSAGRNLYEAADFAANSVRAYKLITPDSEGDEQFTAVFTAADEEITTMTPSVNGHDLPSITMAALAKYIYGTTASQTYPVSAYGSGEIWNIKLTSTMGHKAHLDYLAMHYTRKLALRNGYVAFSQSGEGLTQFDIEGEAEVMRLGSVDEPAALMPTNKHDGLTSFLTSDAKLRYVAFDPKYQFPEPKFEGSVANQDLHAMDSVDMLIIIPTSGKLMGQAQRLAEAHALYDGLNVAVVRADQIYNEFSSGTPDATAYRLFAKHLYDKAADRGEEGLRYLLLMGDCAFDNRMISTAWRKYSPDDYLLCFESENSLTDTQSYVMEDYFGLLDEGEGAKLPSDKVDLGIGRFPVTSAAEAKIMVDKTIDFMSNRYAGNWKNIISILGDDGDGNSHMQYADEVARRIAMRNPEMEVRKVMWDAYDRVSSLTSNTYPEVERLIKKQMEEGALVMNYTGHGATYCLSHEFAMRLTDFESFKGKRLPLWFTAACDVMPFDGSQKNIGETAVLNEGGAAVAFLGTARTVYASNNKNFNLHFMRFLLGKDLEGRSNRLGDAIRLTKTRLITDFDAGKGKVTEIDVAKPENKLQYALLGDPALSFCAPDNRVVLDSINGQQDIAGMQLRAGELVCLSGHVQDADSLLLENFNGLVSARVYDSEHTITCKNNAGANSAFKFTTRNKILFDGQDSVRNGRFNLQFVVPSDISFSNEGGRIVFYAINDSSNVEANGYNEDIIVGGAVENEDKEGPDIYVYLNHDDFPNGGLVGSTPYFVARMKDESGINYSGSGIGHDLLLTVDNDPSTTYILNERYIGDFGDFTRGSVAYELPALPSGKHTLKFRAWDVLNNTSAVTLDFVVDSGMQYTAEVFDFSGKLIWERTATSVLADMSMPDLPKGVYIYRLTTHYTDGKDTKETRKIVVR